MEIAREPAAPVRPTLAVLYRVVTVTALIGAALLLVSILANGFPAPDVDRGNYIEATHRWLATGTPYQASEVAAAFDYGPATFLHPPIALLLFLPFTWLPPILWYVLPVGFTVWCVWQWRPAAWAMAVIAVCLLWPRSPAMLVAGNTDLWMMALAAAGMRWHWPFILIAIKPSFAPLALVGIRHRSWWIAAAVLAAIAALFGGLWLDWFAVVRHAPGGLLYSLFGIPLLLVPIIAATGRTRTPDPLIPWLRRRSSDPIAPIGPANA